MGGTKTSPAIAQKNNPTRIPIFRSNDHFMASSRTGTPDRSRAGPPGVRFRATPLLFPAPGQFTPTPAPPSDFAPIHQPLAGQCATDLNPNSLSLRRMFSDFVSSLSNLASRSSWRRRMRRAMASWSSRWVEECRRMKRGNPRGRIANRPRGGRYPLARDPSEDSPSVASISRMPPRAPRMPLASKGRNILVA